MPPAELTTTVVLSAISLRAVARVAVGGICRSVLVIDDRGRVVYESRLGLAGNEVRSRCRWDRGATVRGARGGSSTYSGLLAAPGAIDRC
jgi:hypothetical protein